MIEKNTLKEVHEKFKGKILEDYETFRERGVSDIEAALLTLAATINTAIHFLAITLSD